MSNEQNQSVHGRLHDQLAEYGRWLDGAAHNYLREKESGIDSIGRHQPTVRGRVVRAITAVATTVLIIAGSFIVNELSGSSRTSSIALAWSETPAEANEAKGQAIVDACEKANPGSAELKDSKTALDIRGSLAIKVWVTGTSVDICMVNTNSDLLSAQVVNGLPLTNFAVSSDVSGVQVLSMGSAFQEIAVVIGRDDVLPSDCRNLDVFTSKGTVRALRASGVFAFWYPGTPSGVELNASTIRYACAVDGSPTGTAVTTDAIRGADPFANLCIATMSVLIDRGIIDQRGRVVALSNWDINVHEDFQNKLQPIAGAFGKTNEVYQAWSKVNVGGLLALDASGVRKLRDRSKTELEVTSAINKFVSLCENARTPPAERGNKVTSTTVQTYEMNPATQTTVLPPE